MKYFIFRYVIHDISNTAVFDSNAQFSEYDLTAELKAFHDHEGVSRKIIYLYPLLGQDQSQLKDGIASAANINNDEISIYGYGAFGFEAIPNDLRNCLHYGNVNILKTRNLILQSDSTFHYINPSGKHSPFFIRTGNILERNEEINFLALQLLRFTEQDFTEIRCDTASILVLVYAIKALKSLFNIDLSIPFNTFHSYSDRRSIKKGSLVLISASSSGDLEDKIIESQSDCRVITIILNSLKTNHRNSEEERFYLINIKSIFSELITKLDNFKQYPVEECEYCNDNSTPVEVRTDQFMPSKVVVQDILIRTHHIPTWFKVAINELTCQKIIFTNRAESSNEKIREIFFDLSKVSIEGGSENPFTVRFNKFLKNSLSASVDLIVYSNDKSSKMFANRIYTFLKDKVKSDIAEPIAFNEVNAILEPEKISMALVVSSCVSNGNRLNAISRALRRLDNASIHYFTALLRLPLPALTKVLQSNLEARPDHREMNKIHHLYEFHLPNHNSKRFKRYERPPWGEELLFIEEDGSRHENCKQVFEGRMSTLKDTSTGLVDNLFFQNPFTSVPLTLRRGFAFHDFGGQTPSQADLYLIFAAIFHCLRNPKLIPNKKEDDRFLIQHEHVRSVLQPENFTRFNDGIIQSCILRLATPAELDYSVQEDLSSKMLSTLKTILTSSDLDSSEAIIEFLYAVAIKKLKLVRSHESEFVSHIKHEFPSNTMIHCFISMIEAR
jgi:hypothetical protein